MTRKRNSITALPPGYTLHPDGVARRGPAPVVKECLTPEPAPKGRGQWAPYRNKTEWRFAQWLATWCDDWHYEKLKFALGMIDGKESWYTPDFVRAAECGDWVAYEVKGRHRFREKGIERLRNAASRWPGVEWWLVEPRTDGGWSLKRVEG